MKNIITDIIDILQCESKYKKYEYVEPNTLKEFINDKSLHNQTMTNNLKKTITVSKSEGICKSPESGNNQKISAIPPVKADTSVFSELMTDVSNCTKCVLCKSRTNVVFGEGNPKTELMIIGEGPGRDEDEQGRPFVGKSGQLLTKMLEAMGFSRENVFIANIVKCRPPNNRVPTPEEAQTCLPYLIKQIEIIKPKVLLLLGATPLKYILDKVGITKIHGEWFEFQGIKTLPSFHPAYLLRDPNQKKYAWEDLQKIMRFLGKPLPSKLQTTAKV